MPFGRAYAPTSDWRGEPTAKSIEPWSRPDIKRRYGTGKPSALACHEPTEALCCAYAL